MDMLTQVIQVVLTLLLSLAATFLLPWLRERLGAEKLKTLWKLVCIAVQASEQLFPGEKTGEQKKQCALDWLTAQGFKADDPLLLQMLEAAVRELT